MTKPVQVFVYRITSRDPDPGQWLDAKEKAKYDLMTSDKRRREYVHTRFFVKSILRDEYGIKNPKFLHRKSGKPYMRGLKFNFSHSADRIALVVSKKYEVGIDIEASEQKRFFAQIAQQYFGKIECDYIFAVKSIREQQKRFKQLWSLKEAYVKAVNAKLSRKALQIHFDIPNSKVAKCPKRKPLSFFYDSKLNMSICVAARISSKATKAFGLAKPLHSIKG